MTVATGSSALRTASTRTSRCGHLVRSRSPRDVLSGPHHRPPRRQRLRPREHPHRAPPGRRARCRPGRGRRPAHPRRRPRPRPRHRARPHHRRRAVPRPPTCRPHPAELRRLDAGSWFSPAYAGERIPTLEQALDVLAGTGTGLLLEVKHPGRYPGIAADVARALARDPRPASWCSPSTTSVMRDFAGLGTGAPGRPARPPAGPPAPALAELGDHVNPRHRRATRTYVDAVHAAGMDCLVWTVDPAGATSAAPSPSASTASSPTVPTRCGRLSPTGWCRPELAHQPWAIHGVKPRCSPTQSTRPCDVPSVRLPATRTATRTSVGSPMAWRDSVRCARSRA